MEVVYFGKKRPKVVTLTIEGKQVEEQFEPFAAKEVSDEFGKTLLKNAGDIFKRYDVERSAPDPKPKVGEKGYVGERSADQVKDLDKVVQKENEIEEGKSAEEVLEEAKKEANETHAKNKKDRVQMQKEKKELLKKEKLI